MINTKIQLWITKIIWSIRHKFQRSITCITFESLKLRPWWISGGYTRWTNVRWWWHLKFPVKATASPQWYLCPVHYPWERPRSQFGPCGNFSMDAHGLETRRGDDLSIRTKGGARWMTSTEPWYLLREQCLVTALALLSPICQKYKYTKPIQNTNLKGETVCPYWNWLQNGENNMWNIMFLWNTQCTKIQKDSYRNDNPKKINLHRKP